MYRTHQSVSIARLMLDDPDQLYYARGLANTLAFGTGTVHVILQRMLAAGWLTDEWENTAAEGRPPRRYYRVTDGGRRQLEHYAAERNHR